MPTGLILGVWLAALVRQDDRWFVDADSP